MSESHNPINEGAPLRAAEQAAAARLRAAGVAGAQREARLLLRWALGVTAEGYAALAASAPLGPEAADKLAAGLEARAARRPLSHVTGARLFWGRSFEAGPDALDPRPESETLVAAALEALRARPPAAPPARVLDLGVGSGCLLLSVLADAPEARGVGVDAAPAARALAARNARALGLAARVELAAGDWLSREDGAPLGRFDLILANPPYIPSAEIESLAPETRLYEPRAALDGGPDGLAPYRDIARDLAGALAPGGVAVFEVGRGQAPAVAAILRAAGHLSETVLDLNGVARVVRTPPG